MEKRIKQLRRERGLSQAALARMVGVSQSTIGMWESGRNMPEFANLEKLARSLGVSLGQLTDDAPARARHGAKVPVLGRVAAGIPIEAIEEIIDYEEIEQTLAQTGEFFGLVIKGDSMEPKFSEGDVVIVRRQEDADSGDVAVVVVNGDYATVKRVKKRPDGIMLISTNLKYEPMFYTAAEVRALPVQIVGKVVELRAKF